MNEVRQERFTEIYHKNEFQGEISRSGTGSDLKNTIVLREKLVTLIKGLKIKTLLDVCGDYLWMDQIRDKLQIEKYIGLDIVPDIIDKNNKLYGDDKTNFVCKDIIIDNLPKGDLLLCRDVLVHLSFDSAFKFIKNFYASDIKYLLVTTFRGADRRNISFPDGTNWYPIDLNKEPFNLPRPLLILSEECSEGDGCYQDKVLGLWTRESLKNVASK